MTTCQTVSLSYLRNVFICLFSFLLQLPFNTHNAHCACPSCLPNHRKKEEKKMSHTHAQTITKKKKNKKKTCKQITKEQEGKGLTRFDHCFRATAYSLQNTIFKQLPYKCESCLSYIMNQYN